MARLEPLPPDRWPPEMEAALAPLRPVGERAKARGNAPRPRGLAILGVFAHHPALARAYNVFNGHLQTTTSLSERQRELVVLRVAALRRSDYVWRQHALLAADAGLSAEEVAAIGTDPEGRRWPSPEGAILRAVGELLDGATLSQATWDVLVGSLTAEQLVDLVFTVGGYDCLAMAVGALEIAPEEDLVALTPPPPFSPSD